MTTLSLLFLGTGASTGIPVIGCPCEVCHSPDPLNKRLRTSALLQINGKNILLDAGPDVRQQLLTHSINRIDGVIITHSHYDHISGLEDLRIFNFLQHGPVDCLLSQDSYQDVQKLFHYHFNPLSKSTSAKFRFVILVDETGEAEFQGIRIGYFSYQQGDAKVLGLRINNFAYITDIKNYSEEIFPFLDGVDTLVLSALRDTPSQMHLTMDDAIRFAGKCGAKNCYITHIGHEIDYKKRESSLPEGIHLAYDGLKIFQE